jgi:hypothetical protein
MEKPFLSLWRTLDGSKETEFKNWAKENFQPSDMPISGTWHPVTKAACFDMEVEYLANTLPNVRPETIKHLGTWFKDQIRNFNPESQEEELIIWAILKGLVAEQENQLLKFYFNGK